MARLSSNVTAIGQKSTFLDRIPIKAFNFLIRLKSSRKLENSKTREASENFGKEDPFTFEGWVKLFVIKDLEGRATSRLNCRK